MKDPHILRIASVTTRRIGLVLLLLVATLSARGTVITYDYDALNRLTNVTYSTGASIRYSYDPAGNRTSLVSIAGRFDTNAPSVPTGLTVVASADEMRLSWNASNDSGGSGLAGYRIYRDNVVIGTNRGANYLDASSGSRAQFCYSIVAFDNTGNASTSGPVCISREEALVNLTNYDSNNPIVVGSPGSAIRAANIFIEVLGGPVDQSVAVLTNAAGQTVFREAEPGFFDGGLGIVPGTIGGHPARFLVRAWQDSPSYDTATIRGHSGHFTNQTGVRIDNAPQRAALSNLPSIYLLSVPVILNQPLSQTASIGGSVVLSVTVTGSPPLWYQWFKNGVPIPDATNSSLALNSVYSIHAGDYSIVVTNAAGSAVSTTVSLKVQGDQPILSGPNADEDGDGWNNDQESEAGTNPQDANSRPSAPASAGTIIASLQVPFSSINFVMSTGQLDRKGADEIVIAADGDVGNSTNSMLILTYDESRWSGQIVDMGSRGVTSLAVGQVSNRASASIYAGTRRLNGRGQICELAQSGGAWQMNTIGESSNDQAFVLGVRKDGDLLASYDSGGALYSVTAVGEVWKRATLSSEKQGPGLGTHGIVPSRILRDSSIRLIDNGNIEVISGEPEFYFEDRAVTLPSGIDLEYRAESSKYYFRTPGDLEWRQAQAYCADRGANLVTIADKSENFWVTNNFLPIGSFWIGLHTKDGQYLDWHWISQSNVVNIQNFFAPFGNYVPKEFEGGDFAAFVRYDGWYRALIGWPDPTRPLPNRDPLKLFGVGEIPITSAFSNRWLLPVTAPLDRIIAPRGLPLSSGKVRGMQSNTVSLFHAFVEDKNLTTLVDKGDDFVLAEYEIGGANFWTGNEPIRIGIMETNVSQTFGMAIVRFISMEPEILFVGEPNGQISLLKPQDDSTLLVKQLFSSYHKGKAWHALAGVKMAEAGEGLVGLRVDPYDPDVCQVVFWPPQSDLAPSESFSQTAPITRILPEPSSGGPFATTLIRLEDAEGNNCSIELQAKLPESSTWSDAPIIRIDGLLPGAVAAYTTGSTHEVVWDAVKGVGSGINTSILLRARARDVAFTGDWSEPVPFQINTADGHPLALPDEVFVEEDATATEISILANDRVDNGFQLLLLALSEASFGVVATNANGTVFYTPNSDYFGSDEFHYVISDSISETSTGMVRVTVAPVNDAPTLGAITNRTILEDAVAQLVNLMEIGAGPTNEVQTLIVSARSSNTGLIPHPSVKYTSPNAAGTLSFAPMSNASGSATITVVVTDDGGILNGGVNSVTNTFTVTVAPVNDLPTVGAIDDQTIDENNSLEAIVLRVSDIETEPDQLVVSGRSSNTVLVLDGNLVFDGSGTDRFLRVTPAAGKSGAATITIRVTDGDGAYVEESFELTVRDTGPAPVTVSGKVRYYEGLRPVPGASVKVSGDKTVTLTTGIDGKFTVEALEGNSLKIDLSKNVESPSSQGVTTLDITLIRRHILGIAALDSPYKLLAADVNGSASVTTLDITFIRRLILGITSNYPAGALWRFVRSDFQFVDPTSPWTNDSVRRYTNLTSDALDQDFVGIKLGDVNGSWTSANVSQQSVDRRASGQRREKSAPSTARGPEVKFSTGVARLGLRTQGKVAIGVSGFKDVTTAQFTLCWDPEVLEFAGMGDHGLAGLGSENFGFERVSEGRLTFSWDDPRGTGITVADGSELFSVEFKAKGAAGNSTEINLADEPTAREVTVALKEAFFESAVGRVLISGSDTEPVNPALRPRLSVNLNEGLKISGTVGSTYRIEYVEELSGKEVWKELRTVVLTSTSQTLTWTEIVGPTNRFYRAVHVP